jgi:hypothetical protein
MGKQWASAIRECAHGHVSTRDVGGLFRELEPAIVRVPPDARAWEVPEVTRSGSPYEQPAVQRHVVRPRTYLRGEVRGAYEPASHVFYVWYSTASEVGLKAVATLAALGVLFSDEERPEITPLARQLMRKVEP